MKMNYEDFDAWKGCHALVLATHEDTKPAAGREPQLVRRLEYHAVAAAGKLAFGAGSRHRGMFRLAVARTAGHLSAFGYHLSLVRVMGILPEVECTRLDALRGRAAFYTWSLLAALLGGGHQRRGGRGG